MKNLLDSKISDEFLKTLYGTNGGLNKFRLFCPSVKTLINLAEMADKIISVYNPKDIGSNNKQDNSHATAYSCWDNFRLSSAEASIESLTQQMWTW
ncbi:hypothetical protein TNCT_417891 [Trichonephila clavata]|uniref:Uncharacterized protein n=1 Tax=Trichonephila clavata TaxID=2740835 RepID=A0A8X6H0A1_TRICU|nr:hypothetical protein TNCT_417891 [Trichonephila clavata]